MNRITELVATAAYSFSFDQEIFKPGWEACQTFHPLRQGEAWLIPRRHHTSGRKGYVKQRCLRPYIVRGIMIRLVFPVCN